MKLINVKTGLAQDGETCFSEAGFQNEDGAFWVFCMEADELCLLVRSEMPMLELAESMDLTEGMPYEVRSADCGGEAPEMQEIECDLFELIAYCGESELEHFECWKHDGGEGIYTAAEADDGIAFVVAYGLLQRAFYPDSDFCASLSASLEESEEIDSAEVESLLHLVTERE